MAYRRSRRGRGRRRSFKSMARKMRARVKRMRIGFRL